MISCLVIYTAWSGYRIVILLIITIYNNKIVMHIASYYIDNDTMQWQRKVIIFGGLNFKAQKLIY